MRIACDAWPSQAPRFSDGISRGPPRLPPTLGQVGNVDTPENSQPLIAYITGSVDQALLLRNEYLVTENRLLRHQIPGRVRLSDGERTTLAEIGKKLGRQALEEVAS